VKKKLIIKNVEDFKKFATGITRVEFKKDCLIDEYKSEVDYEFYIKGKCVACCPIGIGLAQQKECIDDCGQCWNNAIEHIYFKNDIENCKLTSAVKEVKQARESITYDYNKEYTLQEVFDFPDETIFIGIGEGLKVKVDCNILIVSNIKEDNYIECTITKNWMNTKFKLRIEEKKVTFAKVLESNRKCRVDYYSYLGNYESGYCGFGYILQELSNNYDDNYIRNVLKNGTWYMIY